MELVGQQLGEFDIESLLGQGSMGSVFVARQRSLNRQVALKVLEQGLFTPGEQIKRFLREAAALAKLEHPNIVSIYASGEQAPYYYFAMQLVRDGSLEQALNAPVPVAKALGWAKDVCRGLAYTHSQGVVHRDVKPGNILIHRGAALLSDFGLARLRDLSTLTQLGQILGTPLYMSPEQTQGEPARPPCDCFALGVILYQLFCGRHPFLRGDEPGLSRAERRTQLFRRIQNSDYPAPASVMPGLPRGVESVIARALQRRPEDRYTDGLHMLEDLERAG